ncbi:hypothetical protein [Methanogenium cariaci]|uniref:hypothetical protein n=1 Tax=Methanogenium cariaci TaxID=2197 RepID=UPI0007829D71|nr:hypothetical protein [Methanogenium cariaci]
MVDENGRIFFKQRSDPTKADTDGDGLDDYLEDAIESDPLCADTDGDGHSDYEEHLDSDYDPPSSTRSATAPWRWAASFSSAPSSVSGGADEHDNIYYMVGWVASGFFVYGDARDLAASIFSGDIASIGVNLLAFVPGAGDSLKVTAIVGTFVGKHPELLKPAMVLMVGLAPQVDNAAEAIKAIRKAHGDEAIERLLKDGITEDELKVVFHQRGNLARTLEVTKRSDGKVIWLEEGKLGSADGVSSWVYDKGGTGWIHIRNNHIFGQDKNGVVHNQFAEALKDTAYNDENLIKDLIMDCAKTGVRGSKKSNIVLEKSHRRKSNYGCFRQ